jgi:hypothetical protein
LLAAEHFGQSLYPLLAVTALHATHLPMVMTNCLSTQFVHSAALAEVDAKSAPSINNAAMARWKFDLRIHHPSFPFPAIAFPDHSTVFP